ncbi:MAG: hypothetical protein AW07_01402 [Candidatus Accumulibacter sp. SK-11]|nr:MAG: hypothetical protein AW07_01402 [Candidatus Accumulibacter sp. SK-11]
MPGASERTTRPIEWIGEGEGGVSRSMLRAAVAGRLCKAGRGRERVRNAADRSPSGFVHNL